MKAMINTGVVSKEKEKPQLLFGAQNFTFDESVKYKTQVVDSFANFRKISIYNLKPVDKNDGLTEELTSNSVFVQVRHDDFLICMRFQE